MESGDGEDPVHEERMGESALRYGCRPYGGVEGVLRCDRGAG